MSKNMIDYGKLVDDAMHIIVYKVLKLVHEHGLPGNHHFFVSFITKHPGVRISKNLLSKYPREMTIVLQYQFQDLEVDAKGFSVSLSFGGVKEKIHIPFAAITTFADPSVQFGLQFRETEYEYQDEVDIEIEEEKSNSKAPGAKGASKKDKKPDNNVVSLDLFRKK